MVTITDLFIENSRTILYMQVISAIISQIISFQSMSWFGPTLVAINGAALGSRVPEEDEEVGGKSGREERLKSIV